MTFKTVGKTDPTVWESRNESVRTRRKFRVEFVRRSKRKE